MSSSGNESQTVESSSDEEQENEYNGINELMGNLALMIMSLNEHFIFKRGN